MGRAATRRAAFIRHREDLGAAQRTNARGIFLSDGLGQVLGWLLSLACVGASVYTASIGAHYSVSIAFVALLPIASVIRALRTRPTAPAKK